MKIFQVEEKYCTNIFHFCNKLTHYHILHNLVHRESLRMIWSIIFLSPSTNTNPIDTTRKFNAVPSFAQIKTINYIWRRNFIKRTMFKMNAMWWSGVTINPANNGKLKLVSRMYHNTLPPPLAWVRVKSLTRGIQMFPSVAPTGLHLSGRALVTQYTICQLSSWDQASTRTTLAIWRTVLAGLGIIILLWL